MSFDPLPIDPAPSSKPSTNIWMLTGICIAATALVVLIVLINQMGSDPPPARIAESKTVDRPAPVLADTSSTGAAVPTVTSNAAKRQSFEFNGERVELNEYQQRRFDAYAEEERLITGDNERTLAKWKSQAVKHAYDEVYDTHRFTLANGGVVTCEPKRYDGFPYPIMKCDR